MDLRSFSEILARRQGGIYLRPGRSYRRVLTREEVIEIFGGVPDYTVRYGLSISISKLSDESYEVVVRRTKD